MSLSLSRMLFSLLLFALMVATTPFAAEGLLLASSSIEQCDRVGTDNSLPCDKKLVVTLSVDSDQAEDVEEFVILRDAVDKTKGTGEERVEFQPIRLTTSKSRVQYTYPLFYERNFNAKPYEEEITTELVGCDDTFSPKATCGLATDTAGRPIPYSQGFCCRCGPCQLLGLCPVGSRGLQVCDIFRGAALASCLRFGELWYSGYSMGSATIWYRLSVKLTTDSQNNSKAKEAVFELGPDVLSGSSAEFGAWVSLIGDFVPAELPLVLSNKMLFIPSSPRIHERVLAGQKEWLILDKHHVSMQGRDCNKVGVSYEAFSGQGSRCQLIRGSCLADQLEDYRSSDLAVEARGGRGKYLARSFGDFVVNSVNNSRTRLSYWMRGSLATMLTVVISADRLQYLVSVSPGEIVSAVMSKSTIEESSRDGSVSVIVRNIGHVTAKYTLGVGNCSGNVFPIMAQTLSLRPRGTVVRSFDLNIQDVTEERIVQCDVTLRDAKGAITDKKVLKFRVTSKVLTNDTQGGNAPTGGGASVDGQAPPACSRCEWYKISCFLIHGCWWQPLVYVLIAIAILLGIYYFFGLSSRSSEPKLHVIH
ncbi:Generative cell specific 1 protein (GCS1) [Trypanosoma cruzi cruzi]|uniref:Generative cell specific-1/HAP2 domain-containing protein n=1 Tax=Trypanosoma cruzi TaxID=5693 RepID=A0A2V2UTW9_TRYCR|nr:Generative cell specific 1 protein (GCS1) [Trypanosoma cruzi cruzi]PWU86676.1 hypothetical protein C4B63_113g47 [Trypanosoma cruzi]